MFRLGLGCHTMKDEPEIVKILREEELAKLKGRLNQAQEQLQVIEQQDNQTTDSLSIIDDDKIHRIIETLDIEDIGETYRTIFENYAIAVTIADQHERIISWNKYAEELLNMSEQSSPLHSRLHCTSNNSKTILHADMARINLIETHEREYSNDEYDADASAYDSSLCFFHFLPPTLQIVSLLRTLLK